MADQRNIFLIGPMGAGKTSIGKALAEALSLDFYDSDQVIEKRAGADVLWIYDIEGEEGFRQREAKVLAELVKLKGILLATGGGSVALPENRIALAANGTVIYLKTSFDDQLRRIRYCKKRPLAQDPVERSEELQNLRAEFEPLYLEIADVVYNTDHKSTRHIIQELKEILQR